MDSVPPSPPLSALICSILRPPLHKPLHSATARVAAWDAASLRAVGRPPAPSPKVLCPAAGCVARDLSSCAAAKLWEQRTSAIQIQILRLGCMLSPNPV